MKCRILPSILVLVSALAGCEPDPGQVPTPDRAARPIVNGKNENGWPAVGALVADVPGYGYMGSFCTGTLIAPRWVLTAGHCVTPQPQTPIFPQFTKFFVGTNAQGGFWGPSGDLYPVAEFYPHPQYDPNDPSIGHDIGLVLLSQDVTGVTPLEINTGAIDGDDIGAQVLYVGFGASDGKTNAGSGRKRSTTMPITWIENASYNTAPQGSGTCFGDSGGPGLLQDSTGAWKIVGVVSAGAQPVGDEDPCLAGYGIYSRVDAYAAWIAETIGLTLPDCTKNALCFCPQACLPNGSCDNSACQTLTCPQALGCLSRCGSGDAGCRGNCHLSTQSGSQGLFDKLAYCLEQKCPTPGGDRETCAKSNCKKSLDSCLADATPSGDCPGFVACILGCPVGDGLCRLACAAEAAPAAVQARDELANCMQEACVAGTDAVSLKAACAREKCAAQVDACYPPCNRLGGSCPQGTACRPGSGPNPSCVPSAGKTEDAACSPGNPPPCDDGLECIEFLGEFFCRRLCLDDTACGEGRRCVPEAAGGGIGACLPTTQPVPETDADAVGPSLPPDGQADSGSPGGKGGGCASGKGSAGGLSVGLALAVLALVGIVRSVRPVAGSTRERRASA